MRIVEYILCNMKNGVSTLIMKTRDEINKIIVLASLECLFSVCGPT